jgi:hypothetical protein
MNMTFLQNCNFDWIEILNFYERPFRAKLIPSKVWDDLDKYKNDSVGLKNYCKKWRTSVTFSQPINKRKVWTNCVAVGGQYYERKSEIFVHSLGFDTFVFTDKTWNRFKYKFIQTLMHELVHFMQYHRRDEEPSYRYYKWKKTQKQNINLDREYYSCYDEVQAYAHCVFLDFVTLKPNKSIRDLISEGNTPTLKVILKTFDNDFTNNECLRILVREIYRWQRKYKKFS